MNTKDIDKQDFEYLWERAAVGKEAVRLSEEYPTWKRKRTRNRTAMVAATALCIVSAAAIWAVPQRQEKNYESVACNRSGFTDDYWAQLTNELIAEI